MSKIERAPFKAYFETNDSIAILKIFPLSVAFLCDTGIEMFLYIYKSRKK